MSDISDAQRAKIKEHIISAGVYRTQQNEKAAIKCDQNAMSIASDATETEKEAEDLILELRGEAAQNLLDSHGLGGLGL